MPEPGNGEDDRLFEPISSGEVRRRAEYRREIENNLIARAERGGGKCLCSKGDVFAALLLTEAGVGYCEQTSPFVFTFFLREQAPAEPTSEEGIGHQEWRFP